ncbi:MAG TPA: type II toxin-antitoxin system VapC family toxin, partial [Longimicrobium sp.]|nr:type II toxin-antitoxin system VapC family toxin [Longimicrobium sp.]
MALLLDTHTLLWFIGNHPRLSSVAAGRIADPGEIVLVSVVNAWEIVIKLSTGKLTLDQPVAEIWRNAVMQNGFGI